MLEDEPPWRERFARVEARRLSGTWYRMVSRTYQAEAHSDEGSRLRGGRYNPRDRFGGLYLADSPEGCRAELLRRITRR